MATGVAASGAAIGFGTLAAAGAIGGVMGSLVSQGLGVATGLQDKFSWKGVAMAGIAGGIGAGLELIVKGAGFVAGAARGALGNALTQGIGVAVGLQKKFDFAGIAAAGLGGGIGAQLGKSLGAGQLSDLSARNIAANLTTSAASAIANAATRSVLQGTDFGDNLMAALPDVIGSTLGNMIGNSMASSARAGETIVLRGGAQVAASPGEQANIVVTGSRRSPVSEEQLDDWNTHDMAALQLDRDDLEWRRNELSEQRSTPSRRLEIQQLNSRISELNTTITRLNSIHQRLVESSVGQIVEVGGNDYSIRGPGATFNTRQDAARDGIALSFYISSITHDPFERGAILRRVPGGYTYDRVTVGTTPTVDRMYTVRDLQGRPLRRATMEARTPFMLLSPMRDGSTVGYFHIHPASRSSQDQIVGAQRRTHNAINTGFSETDEDIFRGLTNRTWVSYLGGSDGSFNVMQRNIRGRVVKERIERSGYFDTARTRRIY